MWGVLGAAYGPGAIAYLKAFDGWFSRNAAVILPIALVVVVAGVWVALRRRREAGRAS
jgi:hypothetical protein